MGCIAGLHTEITECEEKKTRLSPPEYSPSACAFAKGKVRHEVKTC